jgi:hypothetical protein
VHSLIGEFEIRRNFDYAVVRLTVKSPEDPPGQIEDRSRNVEVVKEDTGVKQPTRVQVDDEATIRSSGWPQQRVPDGVHGFLHVQYLVDCWMSDALNDAAGPANLNVIDLGLCTQAEVGAAIAG